MHITPYSRTNKTKRVNWRLFPSAANIAETIVFLVASASNHTEYWANKMKMYAIIDGYVVVNAREQSENKRNESLRNVRHNLELFAQPSHLREKERKNRSFSIIVFMFRWHLFRLVLIAKRNGVCVFVCISTGKRWKCKITSKHIAQKERLIRLYICVSTLSLSLFPSILFMLCHLADKSFLTQAINWW